MGGAEGNPRQAGALAAKGPWRGNTAAKSPPELEPFMLSAGDVPIEILQQSSNY